MRRSCKNMTLDSTFGSIKDLARSFRAAFATYLIFITIGTSGCCSGNMKTRPLMSLALGQTDAIKISSRCKRQSTGLLVSKDQKYSIVANGKDWWVDFFIPCRASGYMTPWTEWYMRGYEVHKPLPYQPWLALCGRVGPCPSQAFLVSTNWCGSPPNDGELFLFANDAKGWYWNNFGLMRVKITRLK